MNSLIHPVYPPTWEDDDKWTAECGTIAGYLAHEHYGTVACRPCEQAWRPFSITKLRYPRPVLKGINQ